MREKVKDRGRLEPILEAINEIQEYKSQYTLEDVKNSKLVFYGFTKFVEVIGEAVYMLTKEFRASHPEVDWRVIEKMRHLRYLRDFIPLEFPPSLKHLHLYKFPLLQYFPAILYRT